jgi:hypothetical protein
MSKARFESAKEATEWCEKNIPGFKSAKNGEEQFVNKPPVLSTSIVSLY